MACRTAGVERVEQLLDEYRADGLAVVGGHDTRAALSHGQVDVLYLSGSLEAIHADDEEVGRGLFDKSQKKAVLRGGGFTLKIKVTDELVTRALQTEASITFIENPALLADFGGIGATLRYQLNGHKPMLVEPRARSELCVEQQLSTSTGLERAAFSNSAVQPTSGRSNS